MQSLQKVLKRIKETEEASDRLRETARITLNQMLDGSVRIFLEEIENSDSTFSRISGRKRGRMFFILPPFSHQMHKALISLTKL